MRVPVLCFAAVVGLAAAFLVAPAASAAPVTISGTVSYQGTYSGDSLYVAVLDTTGVEDVTIHDLKVYAVGSPPFSQSYSLDFDNAGLTADLIIASFLDVDGGGIDSISAFDVLGWYAGGTNPMGVSPASSQSGLDFDLPRGEIHGTVTFAPTQMWADINFGDDLSCVLEGFRPQVEVGTSGSYSIIGVYPGTYCVRGEGWDANGPLEVCFGGPCASSTPVTVGMAEVKNGIDLDFAAVPVKPVSWGKIKSRYE